MAAEKHIKNSKIRFISPQIVIYSDCSRSRSPARFMDTSHAQQVRLYYCCCRSYSAVITHVELFLDSSSSHGAPGLHPQVWGLSPTLINTGGRIRSFGDQHPPNGAWEDVCRGRRRMKISGDPLGV